MPARGSKKADEGCGRKTYFHGGVVGTRADVYHCRAHHTDGGLVRRELVRNKWGRIVSRRRQSRGRLLIKRLAKRNPEAYAQFRQNANDWRMNLDAAHLVNENLRASRRR